MLLVKMMGGLGNQLFQFSFARYLEELMGEPVWLDTLFFLTHHQRKPQLENLGVRYRKSPGGRYAWYRLNERRFVRFEECTYSSDQCISKRGASMFFWGYWQRSEYAQAGRKDILEGFSRFPKRPLVEKLAREIGQSDSLSVHVRRGDYTILSKYLLLDPDYYRKALDAAGADNARRLYLFSDDPESFKNLIPDDGRLVRMADYGLRDYEEFYLMSLCRRNIAANSTYSWWASFLNDREDRVTVLPARWMSDETRFDIGKYLFAGAKVV